MKALLNSKYFYLLGPIFIPIFLVLVFYHIPEGFYFNVFVLLYIAVPIVVLIALVFPLRMEVEYSFQSILMTKRYRLVAGALCVAVVMAGPLDIIVNGFKLLNPLTYAEFNGYGRYVRHISSLCWILVPMAFVFAKNTKAKALMILYAIIFPILILDRNRLFSAFYVLIFCTLFGTSLVDKVRINAGSRLRQIFFYLLLGLVVFSGLGLFRSGAESFFIESSGSELRLGALPLRREFYYLPLLLQQIILYSTTPIFNFATVAYYEFLNPEFLISQASPFSRELFDTYPYAPVMLPNFNVGTEFYPWLLYGGLMLVMLAFAFMSIFFLFVTFLFKKCPNIFTLLIFLKISYVILFMGFAPQFYLLLNFVFVFLMLLLWLLSIILTGLKLPAKTISKELLNEY